ncbi:MAG: VanW family protein [Defluviitaleaceae bacterium]|nr:VanW family protein [Defluviitaleaceae bacterium]
MKIKKTIFLLIAAVLLMVLAACSNYASDYRESGVHPPAYRSVRTRSSRRSISGLPGPVRQRTVPLPTTTRPNLSNPVPLPTAPSRHISAIPAAVSPTPQPASPSPHLPPVIIPVPESAKPHNPEKITTTGGRVLGTHTTEFNEKEENRVNNITRASNSINGHVIQSGETFSYNQTIGPTIERRGYKKGIIFVDGEKKEGVGGGVCQVSTTLSIAAEEAGMTITERHDHSRPVSYAEEGDEAATSYGVIDFKFKNEKPFPVVINSTVQGGMISVDIREAG